MGLDIVAVLRRRKIMFVIKNEKNGPICLGEGACRSRVPPHGERKEFELRLKLSDASRREEEERYHLFGDRGCSEVGGWDMGYSFVRSPEMKSQN